MADIRRAMVEDDLYINLEDLLHWGSELRDIYWKQDICTAALVVDELCALLELTLNPSANGNRPEPEPTL